MKNYIYLIIILSLTYCSKEKNAVPEVAVDSSTIIANDSIETELKLIQTKGEKKLEEKSKEIIHTLKKKNYEEFSQYIHPEKGVTFSMYANVNPDKDKHFNAEDFDKYISKETKFTWGEEDGTGDLLVLSIKEYLHNWVFRRDFTGSEFFENQFKGSGSTINTIRKFYPNSVFIENYIPGTEIYSGMDWDSLIFVFEEYEGKLYVVAVVNNSWTT